MGCNAASHSDGVSPFDPESRSPLEWGSTYHPIPMGSDPSTPNPDPHRNGDQRTTPFRWGDSLQLRIPIPIGMGINVPPHSDGVIPCDSESRSPLEWGSTYHPIPMGSDPSTSNPDPHWNGDQRTTPFRWGQTLRPRTPIPIGMGINVPSHSDGVTPVIPTRSCQQTHPTTPSPHA
jgi:hypothetical protein